MKLTSEQKKAVLTYKRGKNVRIIAYAGAGKTSTLTAMAKADNRRGLYIAFNKRIAEEAQSKFPYAVKCSTAHSLAFRHMRDHYPIESMTTSPRLSTCPIDEVRHSRPEHKELVAQTLRRFLHSANDAPAAHHVPDLERMGFENAVSLEGHVLDLTDSVWRSMQDGGMTLGHDGYLKLWAMKKPQLRTDVLMIDEAQDLNPVLIGVARSQSCQVISVGDSHQQIYEWRGARDALNILTGVKRRLTQSFRFGEEIAAAANTILERLGEDHPLIGAGPVGTVEHFEKDEPQLHTDAILCRSNGGVIRNLIDALDGGRSVYVPGGVQELIRLVTDAESLHCDRKPTSGELMAFDNWPEVREFSDSTEGSHLKVFVNLVEKYGTGSLLNVLRRVQREPYEGSLTISTTHKGKGLEWSSVKVDEDFFLPGDKAPTPAALRLLYVAMTRAKRDLWIPSGLIARYMVEDED